jgi:hypothetical protein
MPVTAAGKTYYGRKPPPEVSDENRYCGVCKKTTLHNKDGKCLAKTHEAARPFTERIDVALGLVTEAADEPIKFKPDGAKKKSADGTHRPDKGAEYHQLKFDDQFKTLADPYKLR